MKYKSLFTLVFLLGAILNLTAQNDYFFTEGTRFDPKIPSPEKYLGYPIGTLHTRHDAIVGYMRELARVSDRAKLDTIGETYEHRQLVVLTITSPENHRNLETIRKEHLKLTDPNQSVGDYTDMKSVVLLGYNVHGNEPSSSEAAMLTAYYYVAGQSAEVRAALDDAVLMVDPTFNPMVVIDTPLGPILT